jgi:alpha-galactosidase
VGDSVWINDPSGPDLLSVHKVIEIKPTVMKSLQFQNNSYLIVYPEGTFDVRLGSAGIIKCYPGLNGNPISPVKTQVAQDDHSITVVYELRELILTLQFLNENNHLLLKTSISRLLIDRIGKIALIHNGQLSGIEKLLAHGYFSWDQSFLYKADELDQITGNGVTALLTSTDTVILGFAEHDRFFQTFDYHSESNQIFLNTDIFLEGKDLAGTKELYLSDLMIFNHPDLDKGQKFWADAVVRKNSIKLSKPATRGWCSWYYDYFWFSGSILESHLKNFKPFKENLNLDVFVIDANYFEHLGDWLYPEAKFPKGMEYYAKEIEKAGYIPGIWIGPWMVADRSRIFKEHKDWLCRDENDDLIEFMNPLGEDNIWGYRSKIHYCLDTSHPEAFNYLKNVFRTLRNWGYRYFKTDFMFWGSMDRFEGGWYHEGVNAHNLIADKADQPLINRHSPGKTRIEYFIDVLKMIREEIGEESIWLGCGQPIWASAGYVDCMRVSRDVGARWEAHNSPKELLNDLSLRNFANSKFYEVDPDCVLLRNFETKITDIEATSLALYMGVAQGMVLTSDYIHECPPHRIELFKFIQGDNDKITFRPPLLGREDELIIYSGKRRDIDLSIVFFFNAGEEQIDKTYSLKELEIEGNFLRFWRDAENPQQVKDSIKISLKPHHSTLIYLKKTPFEKEWNPKKITG